MGEISTAKLFLDARKKLGLTQREIAVRLDVTETSVRNYESGRRDPDPIVIWNLSNFAPHELAGPLRRAVPESFRRAVDQMGKGMELLDIPEFLDEGKRQAIVEIAEREKKDLAEVYAELVTLGLQARLESQASTLKSSSRPSPKELGAKMLSKLKSEREAHVQVGRKRA